MGTELMKPGSWDNEWCVKAELLYVEFDGAITGSGGGLRKGGSQAAIDNLSQLGLITGTQLFPPSISRRKIFMIILQSTSLLYSNSV